VTCLGLAARSSNAGRPAARGRATAAANWSPRPTRSAQALTAQPWPPCRVPRCASAASARLLAEGLTTESYLDTGNCANFANNAATAIRPSLRADAAHKSWAKHAAAPLCVERTVVEPVWAMLDARARRLGVAATAAPLALVADPALRLVTEQGLQIEPARSSSGRYVFAAPAGAGGLRLLSRTARLSETVGPFVDDRRALGVLVGKVAVWHGQRRHVVSPHLATAALPGWFGVEDGPHRWTDGRAAAHAK